MSDLDSTRLIEMAEERFKELEHKGWEWRSFYNGFLEGSTSILCMENDQYSLQIEAEKSLADELASALALCMGWIIFGEQGFPEQWDDAEKTLAKHREMRGADTVKFIKSQYTEEERAVIDEAVKKLREMRRTHEPR